MATFLFNLAVGVVFIFFVVRLVMKLKKNSAKMSDKELFKENDDLELGNKQIYPVGAGVEYGVFDTTGVNPISMYRTDND